MALTGPGTSPVGDNNPLQGKSWERHPGQECKERDGLLMRT